MDNLNEYLEKYAELAIRVGVNVQPGQALIISAPVAAAEFVRKLITVAYAHGAKNVLVDWDDPESTRIKLEKAPRATLAEFPAWKAQGFLQMAQEGAAFLRVHATNPGVFAGIDPERTATAAKAEASAMQEVNMYRMSGKMPWSIVCVATPEWAAKLFPQLPAEEGTRKLWELIWKAVRVDADDPVAAWQNHLNVLQERLDALNHAMFRKLVFKAPGTDLVVELPSDHRWIGGGLTNPQGIFFVPNIPTEEVFTMPVKTGVNGVVRSTKPVTYNGTGIENFSLTFEQGRIVDFTAETGQDALATLINTDEGSHFLGEVALVPETSPIAQMNVVFHNIGYDENASCHLAIGNAYPICLEDGANMSKEEFEQRGGNHSLTHVDFMIGSPEMDIDAERVDGTRIPLFRKGNWV